MKRITRASGWRFVGLGGHFESADSRPRSSVDTGHDGKAFADAPVAGQLNFADTGCGELAEQRAESVLVVVKFTSGPTAESDDKTFPTEYQGIDAIIKAVSGHGCS